LEQLEQQQDHANPWGHNEIVLNPHSIASSLPDAVLGFFYQEASGEEERREAREAHATFLEDYHRRSAPPPPRPVGFVARATAPRVKAVMPPYVVPLLEFRTSGGTPSFTCVERCDA
jgi:hypothetical protein